MGTVCVAPSSTSLACAPALEAPIEETVSAAANAFSYDPTADRYTYVWKTDKAWAGTCRKFVLTLRDGTLHTALFRFTR